MIYYLIFIILSVFAITNVYFDKKAFVKPAIVFLAIALVLFAGLWYKVGFDYRNYFYLYLLVVDGKDVFVEPIVKGLILLSDFIRIDFNGFIFLMALLAVSIKVKFISRYAAIPIFSLLLYYSRIFIISDFGQIRQGLALSLILISYRYILDRRFWRFLLLVLTATFIHAAAVLFLPVYFIALKKGRPVLLVLLVLLAIPLAAIDLKSIIIGLFANLLPPSISSKLLFYSMTEQFLGLTFSIFLRGGIIMLCLSVFWKKIEENKNYLLIFNIYYIGYIFYLVLNSLPQLGGRGSLYFQQFELLLFPILLTLIKNRLLQLLMLLFFVFYAYWGLNTTITSQDAFIPYKHIFEDDFN